MLSMSARFSLDRINFMADKILSLSTEYVSFSLISVAMTSFFYKQLQNETSFGMV